MLHQFVELNVSEAHLAFTKKMLHFSPNYFFPQQRIETKKHPKTHVPTGFTTENPTEMPI